MHIPAFKTSISEIIFSNKQAARADMIARAREAARDLPPGHRDKEKFSRHRKKPDRER